MFGHNDRETVYGVRTDEDFALPCGIGDEGLREALAVVLQETPYGLIMRGRSAEVFEQRRGTIVAAIAPQRAAGGGRFWLTRDCTTPERQVLGAYDDELFAQDLDNATGFYAALTADGNVSALQPYAAGLSQTVYRVHDLGEGAVLRFSTPTSRPTVIALYSPSLGFFAATTCAEGERKLIAQVSLSLQMARFVPSHLPSWAPVVKGALLDALRAASGSVVSHVPSVPFSVLRRLALVVGVGTTTPFLN